MKFQALVQSLGVPDAQTSLVSMPDLNPDLIGAASIDGAQSGTIAFIEGRALAAQISKTLASALILPQQPDLLAIATQRQIAWIATEQPRLGFAKALTIFYQPWQREPGIHPTAAIDPSVRLGRGVAIGAYATVQAGVVLGDGVCLHDQVAIYPNVWVGDRTVIHAHATIHERSQIGSDCVIQSGVVIGGEGFGFVPTASGWVKMPQSGHVVLEDAVEVGSNSTIDRPSVGETRIGRGTKIDNLVQVGHGCQIGQHCVLVSQVGLAGGVRLGDRAVLAGQVGVAEKVEISAGAIVTAQSGVIQDVRPGDIVSGTPAMPNKLWLRTSLLLRRLPELFQKGS